MTILDLTNRRTLIESLPKSYTWGAEVGVRTGWFAKYILEHTNMSLACIDPWCQNPQLEHGWDDAYALFKFLTEPFGERAIEMKDWSPQASNFFVDESLDFVYIDAEHTYEAVKLDLPAWWKKIKVGGILAGHDYGWETVKKAVDEFAESNGLEIQVTGVTGNAVASLTGDIGEFDGNQPSWVIMRHG